MDKVGPIKLMHAIVISIKVIRIKVDQGIYLPSVSCCCSVTSKSCSWKFSNSSSSTRHEQAKTHKYIQANNGK
jgi:hypothetical protein